jgi:GNAT superfamily N-acetyltransferase
LSRILKRLEQGRLLNRAKSASDGRRRILSLTAKGQEQVALLDGRSQEEIRKQLGRLPAGEQERVVEALETVSRALSAPTNGAPYLLRSHQPGDMGWVVERHGVLYSQEYGWNGGLESMTASIVADFLKNYDSACERCWIAEREGERLGSIFIVRQRGTVAKLRLLLVEPSARGLGLGKRLVEEAVRFGRTVSSTPPGVSMNRRDSGWLRRRNIVTSGRNSRARRGNCGSELGSFRNCGAFAHLCYE